MDAKLITDGFIKVSHSLEETRKFAISVLAEMPLPEQLFLREIANHNFKLPVDESSAGICKGLQSAGLVDRDGIHAVVTFHGSLILNHLLKKRN